MSEGELYESLTLIKELAVPRTPLFSCFSGNPDNWTWHGGPTTVSRDYKNHFDVTYKTPNGVLHRTSGPAYISTLYDIEIWYFDGKMHRVDGPAYRHNDNMVWFRHGKLHRLDGPAVDVLSSAKQYWIDGIKYSPKQYKWEIRRRKKWQELKLKK